MRRRLPIRVPVIPLLGLALFAVGACSKDNPMRPLVVSNVAATVNPVTYLGPCPATFNLSADITARAGTVTYRWERSDGTDGPTGSVSFSGTGTQTIKDTWQPGAVGSFWERVHILSPSDLISNQAKFTNGCGAFAVTAFARVTPDRYSLGCPGTFNFSGDVVANGAWAVTYRWERSDGVTGPTETLTFSGAGTQTVTDSWQVSDIGSYWEVLHLLTPIDRFSDQARFTNSCGAVTAATASASPSQYSGDCPGVFQLSANITAPRGIVTYRWERTDGTTSPTETLAFVRAGTQIVTDTWQLASIGSFGGCVHVLTPNDLFSNQADFANNCGASGPFAVTAVVASVSPTYSYGCPEVFAFSANISANGGEGIGGVTYRWEGSDGTIGPTETLNFTGPGTQTVTTSAELGYEGGSFWWRVHILTPNETFSNQADFGLECCYFCDPYSVAK